MTTRHSKSDYKAGEDMLQLESPPYCVVPIYYTLARRFANGFARIEPTIPSQQRTE
jgi:hypothetical protein